MGEQFIKKHTERFQHQQDAAFQQELATRKLFSDLPDIYNVEYPCRALTPGHIEVGTSVFVQSSSNGNIEVMRGHQVVGMIEGTAAAQLQGVLQSDPRCCGMMKAQIVNQQRLSGGFHIRCAE